MGQIRAGRSSTRTPARTLYSAASGFRGLTCVADPTGPGYHLIASLEGPGDIYAISARRDSGRALELNLQNYPLHPIWGRGLGTTIAAYNDMIAYPGSGTARRPDLLIGRGLIYDANYPGAWNSFYPYPAFVIRHANGSYDFQPINSSAWGERGASRPAP